jgi:hypothetical protein
MKAKTCGNCNATTFHSATYDIPELGIQLPALTCAWCGCLELDSNHATRLLAGLEASEAGSRRYGALREQIERALETRSLGARAFGRLEGFDATRPKRHRETTPGSADLGLPPLGTVRQTLRS